MRATCQPLAQSSSRRGIWPDDSIDPGQAYDAACVEAIFDVPVKTLKGVGPKIVQRLQRLGIVQLRHLVFYRPLRYQDRCRIHALGSLDRAQREIMVCGRVVSRAWRGWRKRSLVVVIDDDTGALSVHFFGGRSYVHQYLDPGAWLQCFGDLKMNRDGRLVMIHPECTRIEGMPPEPGDSLTAVYPAMQGISQSLLRRLVDQTLRQLPWEATPHTRQQGGLKLTEYLPASELRRTGMCSISQAIMDIHYPPLTRPGCFEEVCNLESRRRLACEELLVHYLAARAVREQYRDRQAVPITTAGRLLRRFRSHLPFIPTPGQEQAVSEIVADLGQARPMMRLLHGDVGCGKTLVAVCAILQVIEAGMQAVLMAPTEVLGRQHYRLLQTWFEPLGIRLERLSGGDPVAQRRKKYKAIATGQVAVIVGTHALLQPSVSYKNLGLVVVDEQHRFGVQQRCAMLGKGGAQTTIPHQLILSATPIPRTLAMTLYADLDVSLIRDLPPGRQTVETLVIPEQRRLQVLQRIRTICQRGHQVYWVCTAIDQTPQTGIRAAVETATTLASQLPGLRIEVIHGRMRTVEKDSLMDDFECGRIDVIVATTVIEVGVDATNAGLIVIENAERLGLSQLHQLRGRVGRDSHKSYCILMYHGPLTEEAHRRLGVLRSTGDGFELARQDLDIRGPGEVFGTRQAGGQSFRFADSFLDEAFLGEVRRLGDQLMVHQTHQVPLMIRRWFGDSTGFAAVG